MRTAQQMRALSPEIVVDNILSEFEKTAVEASKSGRTSIRLYQIIERAGGSASNEVHMYVYERKPSDLMKKVEARLVEAGYKVSALYEERQFVDMDIVVSWAAEIGKAA